MDCTRYYRQAIAFAQQALSEDRESPDAMRTRAEAFLGLGDCLAPYGENPVDAWRNARRDAASVLSRQPSDHQARAIREEAEARLLAHPRARR